MAEALLRAHLADRGIEATVWSAGIVEGGVPAAGGSKKAMAAMGLDLAAHRSRRMTPAGVAGADLVLAMARAHLREAVLMRADAWPRTFTLKELVRRGRVVGTRPPAQPLSDWLAHVHAGRTRTELLGESRDDDVEDPMGGPDGDYVATAAELDRLLVQLVDLAFPAPALAPAPAHTPAVDGPSAGTARPGRRA